MLVGALLSGCGSTRLASESRPSSAASYPVDLAIIYYANDAEFNSFDGYIIKNFGSRSVRTTFTLSESEKVRIYEAVKEMDLPSYGGSLGSGGSDRRSLRVRCENTQTDLSWSTHFQDNDDATAKLKNLQQVLDDALFNNGYYLSLPPYEGPPRL